MQEEDELAIVRLGLKFVSLCVKLKIILFFSANFQVLGTCVCVAQD